MSVTTAASFFLGIGIAAVNGANDVSKGVATLVGSGVTNTRRAVLWGTLWTGIGALAASLLARAMVQTFGTGLFSTGVHPTLAAAFATIAGAALWVFLATLVGMPVSTTHAIIGSVAGVALLAYSPAGVRWSVLGGKVFLPLLLSPVLASLLTAAVSRIWSKNSRESNTNCVCLEVSEAMLAASDGMLSTAVSPELRLSTCAVPSESRLAVTVEHLHWITSGATSFSRALNDAPKMVALVLGVRLLAGDSSQQAFPAFFAVAAGMLLGSAIAGQRVTKVLACDVVPMTPREGFTANLVTAALVGPGAALGIPMSTTHVSAGAIIGIAGNGEAANGRVIRDMLIAWLVTIPVSALLGMTIWEVLRRAGVR